uniref:Thioredoxin-like protein 1 (inferred by orthology to a human protein) n=1 Tax=Strongyloides venezuelensis TaxID=75913 RepID=A0A0K0G2X2_STRVS
MFKDKENCIMPVHHVKADSELTEILGKAKATPVIVDFFAVWCGPCNRIAPTFESLSNKYLNVKFVKVDVDICKGSAIAHGVQAMPTFIMFLNGTKQEVLSGANAGALEQLIAKFSNAIPSEESLVPGQSDLKQFINKKGLECLNEDDNHTFSDFIEGKCILKSDCDEQLIMNIPFNVPIKLHSIFIKGSGPRAPKTVKIFSNVPHTLDFDKALASEGVQSFDLDPKKLPEGEIVNLRYVKFQNVQNIQIFIENNQGDEEVTVIQDLKFFGTPVTAVDMNNFKRVAGKAGEAHD